MCVGDVEKRRCFDIHHCNEASASTLRVSSDERKCFDIHHCNEAFASTLGVSTDERRP